MVDAGATRLGLHATGGATGGVSTMIDHTLLKPDASRQEIEKLCREAAEFHFATVCVNPAWVAAAAKLLRGTGVGVCSVVGLPARRDHRGREAIRDPAGDLRRRDRDRHGHQHRRAEVRRPAHGRARHRSGGGALPPGGVISKVIIEAALLTDEEKVDRVDAVEGRRCGFREDLHRLRPRRRDGRRRGADAPRGRRRHGRQGRRRRPRPRRTEADGRRRAPRASAPAPASRSSRNLGVRSRRRRGLQGTSQRRAAPGTGSRSRVPRTP